MAAGARLFPFWRLVPPPIPTERMINGGFEIVDWVGWSHGIGAYQVETIHTHAGAYACLLEYYATEPWISQTLSEPVLVSSIASFTLWASHIAGSNKLKVTVTYSDTTTEIIELTIFTPLEEYIECNLLPYLDTSKSVSAVRAEVYETDALTWVDDISLMA